MSSSWSTLWIAAARERDLRSYRRSNCCSVASWRLSDFFSCVTNDSKSSEPFARVKTSDHEMFLDGGGRFLSAGRSCLCGMWSGGCFSGSIAEHYQMKGDPTWQKYSTRLRSSASTVCDSCHGVRQGKFCLSWNNAPAGSRVSKRELPEGSCSGPQVVNPVT